MVMAHSLFIFALLLHLLRLCGGTGASTVKHDAMVAMSLSDNGLVRREETKETKERVKWHRQWRVKCDTTKGNFHIQMDPESSPQGVRRFLDLVRDGFFQDQETEPNLEVFVVSPTHTACSDGKDKTGGGPMMLNTS